jgi:two-component system chemotaxis sensor kinase CheA
MDELLEQFLIEAPEQLQQATEDLLVLEDDPANTARIDSVFRAVHTLKGSVALFDFAAMGAVLHAAEDVLGVVRSGRLRCDHAVNDALLDSVGACDNWLKSIAATGRLPSDARRQSGRLVDLLISVSRVEATSKEVVADTGWVSTLLDEEHVTVRRLRDAGKPVTAIRYVPDANCFFGGEDPISRARNVPGLAALKISGAKPWMLDAFDPYTCNLVLTMLSTAPPNAISDAFKGAEANVSIVEAVASLPSISPSLVLDNTNEAASRMLRVDAERIDALVDIVGEMIVAKNGLAHLIGQANSIDPQLGRALSAKQAEIDRLVGDMHRAAMNVRMVPLSRTFRRLPRLVRDLASRLEKSIALEIRGDDVEADKAVVDGLFDPLLHVLRNAVDHGIEDPASRQAAGKSPTGRVRLEAERKGDQIAITIADDGKGIDIGKIRRSAVAASLMPEGDIAALDDAAAIELIFAPGFSTASTVTDVSGRGVGMDAARTAIESLGGRITVQNAPAAGVIARITIPQAVVITTVMTVAVGEQHFGVPLDAIVETVRIPVERIKPIRSGAAFVLRDRTIPFLKLSELLKLSEIERRGDGATKDDARILVTTVSDQLVGIEVSGFAQRLDVQLRPMTGLLAGMPGLLGSALLGDGRVLVVLDLPGLVA